MDDNVKDCIKFLREWLAQQPHLPHNLPDAILMKCWNSSNRSLELAKNLIDSFCTTRSRAPEIFTNRGVNDPEMKNNLEMLELFTLNNKPNNQIIFVCRVTAENPENFDYLGSNKAFTTFDDLYLFKENAFYEGDIMMIDLEKMSLKHLPKLTLSNIRKMIDYFQEARPTNLKQIHFVHTPPFVEKLLLLVKPFVKESIMKLVVLHSSFDTLHEHIPKEYLPTNYGGTDKSIEEYKKEWMERVENNQNLYTDNSLWQVDESKRPKGNPYGKEYGMQGSFRTLDID